VVQASWIIGLFSMKRALPSFTIIFLTIEFFWVLLREGLRRGGIFLLDKVVASELRLQEIHQVIMNGGSITMFTFISALHSFLVVYFAIKLITEALFWLMSKQNYGLMPYLIGILIFGLIQSFYVYVTKDTLFIPFFDGFFPFIQDLPIIWRNTTWL